MVTRATTIRANGDRRLMAKLVLSVFLDITTCDPRYSIRIHLIFRASLDCQNEPSVRRRNQSDAPPHISLLSRTSYLVQAEEAAREAPRDPIICGPALTLSPQCCGAAH